MFCYRAAWLPKITWNASENKVNLIVIGTNKEKVTIDVGEVRIEESDDEKLLSITLDKELSFAKHPNGM